jgi:dsRNA-specific ribonuclease
MIATEFKAVDARYLDEARSFICKEIQMAVISEKQLRRSVRKFLLEKNFLREQDEEMTGDLSKIIMTLGVGKEVNKAVLGAAMKAGEGRNAKQNKVVADLFMAILDKPDMMTKVIPLLKRAAKETEG